MSSPPLQKLMRSCFAESVCVAGQRDVGPSSALFGLFPECFLLLRCREWYTNGDCLVLLVSVIVILPLSLLRNLGEQCVCECVVLKYEF